MGIENGIVSGYNGYAAFGPNDPVTREQVAVFLMRYAEKIGADVSGEGDLSGFADAERFPTTPRRPWHGQSTRATSWVGQRHRPASRGDIASRAEVATMLMRFCEAQQDQVKKLK